MRGITKVTRLGGIMIRGGGIYGYKEQSFFFQQSGVVNTKIFEQAIKGKQIKIIDWLYFLKSMIISILFNQKRK